MHGTAGIISRRQPNRARLWNAGAHVLGGDSALRADTIKNRRLVGQRQRNLRETRSIRGTPCGGLRTEHPRNASIPDATQKRMESVGYAPAAGQAHSSTCISWDSRSRSVLNGSKRLDQMW